MSFTDLLVAWRNLLQHTKRTVFLGAAIGATTLLLVLLTGLSSGIRETMIRSATTLVTGHLNVAGFYKVTSGQAAPVVTDYEKVLGVVKKTLPELDFAVERGRGFAKAISDTGSMQLGLSGVDIDREQGLKGVLSLEQGKLEDLKQPGTILLFHAQAEKLGVKVGDALTISAATTRGVSNTIDLRVVAVARDMGLMSMFTAYMPNESLRQLYQLNATSTGALQLYFKDRDLGRLGDLGARLRKALADAGYRVMDPDPRVFWMKFQTVNREDWTGQKLDVTSWEDEISFMSWTLTALRFISTLLIIILLAIVVVGIMNTMWIAIRERTREIGTLRAMGMQRTRVLGLFMLEALLLGLMSTAVGALAGAGAGLGLNAARIPVPLAAQLFLMSPHLRIALHPGSLVAAVVAITAVTGIAALYPSLRAARLTPIDAMSHFG